MRPRTVIDAAELARVQADLAEAHPREVIGWALQRFATERRVVVTGLQSEGVAVADMAIAIDPDVRVLTIDTGRLPDATIAYREALERHWGRAIEVVRPDAALVEAFTAEHGADPFLRSVPLRLDCCHLRKVAPLECVLAGVDCWFSGLRRDQTSRRAAIDVVELDARNGDIVKVNALAAWSEADVAAYIGEHGVPVHPLYAQGYRSIGCAPCTRAVAPGEDARAGRWWWESGVDKECGMHVQPRVATEVGA